jgi:hypothetical protein
MGASAHQNIKIWDLVDYGDEMVTGILINYCHLSVTE